MAYNYYPIGYNPYSAYYQPQIYQPQQPQAAVQPAQQLTPGSQPPAAPQQSGIIWVSSEAEAQAYPVAPNNAVALWDSTRSTIYLKQADASGKPVLKTYDLTERPESSSAEFSGARNNRTAVTEVKREIEDLWAAVEELRQRAEPAKRNIRRKEAPDDDE